MTLPWSVTGLQVLKEDLWMVSLAAAQKQRQWLLIKVVHHHSQNPNPRPGEHQYTNNFSKHNFSVGRTFSSMRENKRFRSSFSYIVQKTYILCILQKFAMYNVDTKCYQKVRSINQYGWTFIKKNIADLFSRQSKSHFFSKFCLFYLNLAVAKSNWYLFS